MLAKTYFATILMVQCLRFRVTGRVQGVGYRAATLAKARQLRISGWVRNTADGAVELVASGEAEVLEVLAAWLENGPPMAQVAEVTQVPSTLEHEFNGTFVVRR